MKGVILWEREIRPMRRNQDEEAYTIKRKEMEPDDGSHKNDKKQVGFAFFFSGKNKKNDKKTTKQNFRFLYDLWISSIVR